mgnify:CR=1 FL=1
MADLNELNEKVEQIKADIREQLEKIDLYFVIVVYSLIFHFYSPLPCDFPGISDKYLLYIFAPHCLFHFCDTFADFWNSFCLSVAI